MIRRLITGVVQNVLSYIYYDSQELYIMIFQMLSKTLNSDHLKSHSHSITVRHTKNI